MATRAWLAAAVLLAAYTGGPVVGPDEDVPAILERQTQQLLDAITSGSAPVWERLLDPRVSFTTEDGEVRSKAAMVGDVRPLPKTITGSDSAERSGADRPGNRAQTRHAQGRDPGRAVRAGPGALSEGVSAGR